MSDDLTRLGISADLAVHYVRFACLCGRHLRVEGRHRDQSQVPRPEDREESKLLVRRGGVEVKVEVNTVMRGTVEPVRTASLTPNARDALMADLEIPVVSLPRCTAASWLPH